MKDTKVALITGSAKRIGAAIAKYLHTKGMRVVIHYNNSVSAAQLLCDALNKKRSNSAATLQANLEDIQHIARLVTHTVAVWGRLDVLINNASVFETTPLKYLAVSKWHQIISNNLTAPFFLSVSAAPHLQKRQGCIINLLDIRSQRPLKQYTPYCVSKAALSMATKSLAVEWAPDIRVNGIAPGVVLWPDQVNADEEKVRQKIIARTPLKQVGTPQDIAKATYFLIEEAPYVTGQVIYVDGGRSLV